jgi:formiminotetrahydrofolate cyclodeaminase
MSDTSWNTKTIEQYLSALGAGSPAPGGGAEAAFLGAQACAMALMTTNFTLSNPHYADFHDRSRSWKEALEMGQGIMIDLMSVDEENFQSAMRIWKLPKDTPNRKEKMQEALELAMGAPVEMANTMTDLVPLFAEILKNGNKNLVTDSIIAARCAVLSIEAAILNVRINAIHLTDEIRKKNVEDLQDEWEKKADFLRIALAQTSID